MGIFFGALKVFKYFWVFLLFLIFFFFFFWGGGGWLGVATLSVNKLKLWLAMYTPRSIVSTLTVAVATLSVNKLKDCWQRVF